MNEYERFFFVENLRLEKKLIKTLIRLSCWSFLIVWKCTLPETNSFLLKIGRDPKGNWYSNHPFSGPAVDGRNPAPVDMVNILFETELYTSQVVQDFFHQQYVSFKEGKCLYESAQTERKTQPRSSAHRK